MQSKWNYPLWKLYSDVPMSLISLAGIHFCSTTACMPAGYALSAQKSTGGVACGRVQRRDDRVWTEHPDGEGFELGRNDSFQWVECLAVQFCCALHGNSYGQSEHDDWLSDYHMFQDNPVIMMNDGAYLKVEGKKTTLYAARPGSCAAARKKKDLNREK